MEVPYYIHSINPVLWEIAGPLAVRWYGLAYVAGFIVAYALLARWARQGTFRTTPEQAQVLIFYSVIGVMLGGRLGFLLFYDLDAWLRDPALLFKVWQGGMSSHGGFIGLTIAMWAFGRTQSLPFLHVADNLVCAGSLGIFFGRLANFINGELWGRVTTLRWAVLFPQEAGMYPPHPDLHEQAVRLYHAGMLHPRHPSQLYAAIIEGLLVFLILLAARQTAWGQKTGHLAALFLISYAAGRIAVEFFREPEIVYFGWLTQGQLLSLFMLPIAAFILRSSSGHKT